MKPWLARLILLLIFSLFLIPWQSVIVRAATILSDTAFFQAIPVPDHIKAAVLCEKLGVTREGRLCYEKFFSDLLVAKSAEQALKSLSDAETQNIVVKKYCHGIAHLLGKVSYFHYGTLQESLLHGGTQCASGYYHGAIEVALQNTEDRNTLIREACQGFPQTQGSFLLHWCNHGLGHGLLASNNYDLLSALSECEILEEEFLRQSCFGGAFMENIDGKFLHEVGGVQFGLLQDDGSDFWPCLSVDERFRKSCFGISTARVLKRSKRDWQYTASACDRLSDPHRLWCFKSFGRDVGGEGLHAKMSRVNDLCSEVPLDMQGQCLYAAAHTVASHFADPARANVICLKAGFYEEVCEEGAAATARSLKIDSL